MKNLLSFIRYGVFVLGIGCVFLGSFVYASPFPDMDIGDSVPSSEDPSDSGGYILLEPSLIGQSKGSTVQPGDYLYGVFWFMLGAAGVLAVLTIAIGGIEYMVSGANPSKKKEGQEKMTAAIFGLLLALGAWLILNTINPDFVNFDLELDRVTVEGNVGVEGNATNTPGDVPSNLPVGCSYYASAFKSAAKTTGVSACLLQAVASAESSCNPNAGSSAGACGIMQMLPSTANASCNWLKANPEASILSAAYYLKRSAAKLSTYDNTFDIGNAFGQSGKTVKVGGFVYDRGNDDLIAAYNAGNGTISTNGRGPFSVSQDCPASVYGTAIPAWQCHINPGGFSETQHYVRNVQTYQDMCGL